MKKVLKDGKKKKGNSEKETKKKHYYAHISLLIPEPLWRGMKANSSQKAEFRRELKEFCVKVGIPHAPDVKLDAHKPEAHLQPGKGDLCARMFIPTQLVYSSKDKEIQAKQAIDTNKVEMQEKKNGGVFQFQSFECSVMFRS
uniref:Uncharacterized protein n=1 Tax=Chromera velia CCMP2878 TaxID=1169474 RepID=A0A0G4I0C9_9ALVE|mmetsp:Transcript_48288/g.95327  ORF Transcript_48288/g.95327 Transcript_48288/m.95327 type:complete len:142 (-) Transcript_48288:155-580(-)|eukprot:Cvel_9908.t1-p1 / transcript=Cvel_9908.t1 / gene=Cvel_9908 / organism=Chromera_velia_CCMP2878 / gene_product=hypothetical protein / transcript_product=hypothetical protein / location=Cvel_scaffold585:3874-4644(+) / protein_length=141 / sequence_SO=supercontig / SO=protein_coding / is_pseudo=false